ncbi:Os05g0370100, partial [Oryza sativa Japonica Group]
NLGFSTKFDQRRSWVPAYFSDIPLLGLLRTTSRSESADSFFSRLIGWKLALVEFWLRLDAALEEQRHKELEEDNITLHTIRNLKTEWVIEKHASEFFTT